MERNGKTRGWTLTKQSSLSQNSDIKQKESEARKIAHVAVNYTWVYEWSKNGDIYISFYKALIML